MKPVLPPRLKRALPALLALLWTAGATALVFAYVKHESNWLVGAFLLWVVFPVTWLLDPKGGGEDGP